MYTWHASLIAQVMQGSVVHSMLGWANFFTCPAWSRLVLTHLSVGVCYARNTLLPRKHRVSLQQQINRNTEQRDMALGGLLRQDQQLLAILIWKLTVLARRYLPSIVKTDRRSLRHESTQTARRTLHSVMCHNAMYRLYMFPKSCYTLENNIPVLFQWTFLEELEPF